MAMTVLYNSGAQLALSTLNKNKLQANNSLLKLASGEKFIGAQGESSSYAISEKMREQIRSLYQDEQNVQNGSSLVRTAERGIDQIIENLRTMKEKAIDAANDSNTDEDRHTIQKEIDERRKVISDIAIGTKYNSKILLDGRWAGGLLPLTGGGGGLNTTVQNIADSFSASGNTTSTGGGTNYVPSGYEAWQFNADAGFSGAGTFSVGLDFSDLQVLGSYPDTLQNQGFCILCGGCMQYINFRFDATKTSNQSTYSRKVNVADDGTTNSRAREFVIGVKNVKKGADLADAIFNGVSAVSGQITGSYASQNTSNNLLVDNSHNVRIMKDSSGKIFLTKNGPTLLVMNGTVQNPVENPPSEAKVEEKSRNPLWIQHGTRAGQRMHVYINNMRSEALGIDDAEVVTREKATDAIGIIDSAIESALDEATNMGAYLQRFETSYANIVTMNENAQGSESTIRDADMAKEITEYTKYNLLSQSAQAMLTQANLNSSSVLGLLQ